MQEVKKTRMQEALDKLDALRHSKCACVPGSPRPCINCLEYEKALAHVRALEDIAVDSHVDLGRIANLLRRAKAVTAGQLVALQDEGITPLNAERARLTRAMYQIEQALKEVQL